MTYLKKRFALLLAFALGSVLLLAFSAVAMVQPSGKISRQEEIAVGIQNAFMLENVNVFVDDQPWGMLRPNETRTAMMQRGSHVFVKPDISGGTGFRANPQGLYQVYPPCLGCPAQVRYLGE